MGEGGERCRWQIQRTGRRENNKRARHRTKVPQYAPIVFQGTNVSAPTGKTVGLIADEGSIAQRDSSRVAPVQNDKSIRWLCHTEGVKRPKYLSVFRSIIQPQICQKSDTAAEPSPCPAPHQSVCASGEFASHTGREYPFFAVDCEILQKLLTVEFVFNYNIYNRTVERLLNCLK